MLAMDFVVIGYANMFSVKCVCYILDEWDLRKLRTEIWVVLEAVTLVSKKDFEARW